MKTATVLALSSTLVLAGCARGIPLPTVPPECVADTSISVQWGPGQLEVDRECARVAVGDSLTITFNPTPSRVGEVETKIKGIGQGWLEETTTSSEGRDDGNPATIVLTVPPGKGGPGDAERRVYKYEIHVDGVGVLDPRIVIQ